MRGDELRRKGRKRESVGDVQKGSDKELCPYYRGCRPAHTDYRWWS